MQVLFPMRDVDWLDGIGKRVPIVISGIPHSVAIDPGLAVVRRRIGQVGEDGAAGA